MEPIIKAVEVGEDQFEIYDKAMKPSAENGGSEIAVWDKRPGVFSLVQTMQEKADFEAMRAEKDKEILKRQHIIDAINNL